MANSGIQWIDYTFNLAVRWLYACADVLGITYEEIDIDFDKEAYKKVSELQNRKPRIPTIVFDDGSYLVEPTDVELLEKINSYQS